MQLINFVFAVIKEISPIDPTELSNLKHEIQQDIDNVVIDPKHEMYKEKPMPLKARILGWFANPWVRLGMAASFLLVVKSIKDWYNSSPENNEEEEED